MNFTLRWANRSNAEQDWMVHFNGRTDNFHLSPDHVRSAAVTVNHNCSFQIAVSAESHFAAATLQYTALTNTWTLNSSTPNEFQLVVGGAFVTVRCFLNDAPTNISSGLAYEPSEPIAEADNLELLGGYPAYQCFKTKARQVYSSSYEVKNHDQGAAWVGQCMQHYGIKGSDLLGKPYLSNNIPQGAITYP